MSNQIILSFFTPDSINSSYDFFTYIISSSVREAVGIKRTETFSIGFINCDLNANFIFLVDKPFDVNNILFILYFFLF